MRHFILKCVISLATLFVPAVVFAEIYSVSVVVHGHPFSGYADIGFPPMGSPTEEIEMQTRVIGKDGGTTSVVIDVPGTARKLSEEDGYEVWEIDLAYAGATVCVKVYPDKRVEFFSTESDLAGLTLTLVPPPTQ